MINKTTPVEYLKEIYWVSHFLFFCGAFLMVVFAQPIYLHENFAAVSFNIAMIASLGCFLLLNYLFYKTCEEGFNSSKYTYRILYAIVLICFTLSFSSIFNVEMHKLLYSVPIVLISLTSGFYLGLISSLLFMANTAIYSKAVLIEDMQVFIYYIIIAWVVGKIADANKAYALKLEEERDFLKDLIQTFSEGVLISDLQGKIILCNKKAEQIFQKANDELIGHGEEIVWQNFLVPAAKWNSNFTNMQIENHNHTYLISRFILKGSSEEANCFVIVINDITELQRQRGKIQRLETLSAIGELAAGAAHEIRNPLTTVRGFLQLAQARGEGEQFGRLYNLAIAELDRINVIITSMLELSRSEKGELSSLNINEIINEVWELYTYSGRRKGINYQQELGDNVLPFYGSAQQIKQLLLNIIQNAQRACGDNGTIIIRTYSNDTTTFIEIQDTGKGIAPEHLPKIMHPFFTTEANGTGLGLAICNRIIEDNNGNVKVASQLGVGTTFTIMFPVMGENS
ncbi:ATP-binding protein [Peptococcaceae bacterium 1198_IL3148]